MKINITLLNDEHDCDTCGISYAEGAIVEFEDGTKLEFIPHAHCLDTKSWDSCEVLSEIIKHLGHDISDVTVYEE